MVLSKVFERFVQHSPVTMIARAAMEHALAPDDLNRMFDQVAEEQYTRELLFSSLVDLMGVVVAKTHPSVNTAFHAVKDTLPVSITAVYNKLNGIEPCVVSALVFHCGEQLAPVIRQMRGGRRPLLGSVPVRILDGNHLAATARRLEVLRGSIAGPLPGHALVVLDPELMLALHMIPCEDGHAQERSLTAEILDRVAAAELWIADRNFCTSPLMSGVVDRSAYYLFRQHANVHVVSAGTLSKRGRIQTGWVYEQSVTLAHVDGTTMRARRLVVRLDKPTRDGDAELALLTNLPPEMADALTVASLYRDRWTLETMFQSMTQMLHGEINALGYPRAALFGFGVALAAYNVLSTVQAALRANFGAEHVEQEVSGYYIANEVRTTVAGMDIAVERAEWVPFQTMKTAALAQELVRWASHARLGHFQKHRRGPKKPVPKRTRFPDKTHVSTARLLAEARKKSR